jgi:hypothetical protein
MNLRINIGKDMEFCVNLQSGTTAKNGRPSWNSNHNHPTSPIQNLFEIPHHMVDQKNYTNDSASHCSMFRTS